MPTNPFIYNPQNPIGGRARDEREGWWGRTQRPGGDIVLPPEGPELPTLPPAPPNRMPQPYIPDPNPSAPNLPAVLAPNETVVPNALDRSPMRGIASYNGPKLNTESALAGLKNSSSTANAANYAGLLPESEVMRLASRDSNEVAPGANAYWQSVLGGRRANSQALDNTQDIGQTNSAIQGLHPGVQQLAENTAQRQSYPAQAQASGVKGAAKLSAEGDIMKQRLVNAGLDAHSADTLAAAYAAVRERSMGLPTLTDEDRNMNRFLDEAIQGLYNQRQHPQR